MWLADADQRARTAMLQFLHGIDTEAHDRYSMQGPRSLPPWSLCNGLNAVITECSRIQPNNGPEPTIIVPQNKLKSSVLSRSASGHYQQMPLH